VKTGGGKCANVVGHHYTICLEIGHVVSENVTLATLPWTCDDFHRQRTFVLRILSLPFFHPFASFYFPVVLFTF